MSTPLLGHSATLTEFLQTGAHRWPDQAWCRTPGGDTSRQQAMDKAQRVAATLVKRGVVHGDHVVLVLPNGLDFIHAWFGAVLVGAITVAINPKAASSELSAVEQEVKPRLIVVTGHAPTQSASTEVATVDELVTNDPLNWQDTAAASPDDPVSYIQSSGSTGRPKFIIETQSIYTMAAEGYPHWLGVDEDDVLLTTLPLSHLNAQAYSLLGSYGCGAQLVLLPRFSATTFWDEAERYGATVFNAIGAMVEALMSRPPCEAETRSRVRICYSAPAPSAARHRQIEERFGFRLAIGYALSESPYGMIVPIDRPVVPGSMGVPRQHPTLGEVNRARLVDTHGNEVGAGEVGELELCNPAITPGYFGDADESARVVREGWLRTGDLATRDEQGYYYFVGRVKEIIRHKGENLSPTEVENALSAHPAVAGAAVIGVPSPMSEEDIKAFVVLRREQQATADDLGHWCADRLPPYKRPRYIEFVEQFPLTETQKIAKRRLPVERTDNETDLVQR